MTMNIDRRDQHHDVGLVALNRARFVAAMAHAGFKNYEQEWWHFSYDVPATSLRRFNKVIR